LPEGYCKNVHCEYNFYLEEAKHTTEEVKTRTRNPIFNYRKHHTIEVMTGNFINYLMHDFVK